MVCALCDLVAGNIVTRHYYTDSTMIIVDCETCGTPMVVFNHHRDATPDERRQAINVISELFGYSNIRKTSRKIMGHEHWHLLGAIYRGENR